MSHWTNIFPGAIIGSGVLDEGVAALPEPSVTVLALTPGAYWKLNDPFSGAPNAIDHSVGGNDGTAENLEGADYQIVGPNIGGLIPQGMNFSGVDEAVGVPVAASIYNDTSFTITAWFKANALSAVATIYSEGENDNTNLYILLRLNSTGELQFGVRARTGQQVLLSTVTQYDDDVWHYVEATRITNSTWRLRVDGGDEQILLTQGLLTQLSTIDHMAIGVFRRNIDTGPMIGQITEVPTWPTGQSIVDMDSIYAAGGGT